MNRCRVILKRIRIILANVGVVLEFSKSERLLKNTMQLNPALWETKWIMDRSLFLRFKMLHAGTLNRLPVSVCPH